MTKVLTPKRLLGLDPASITLGWGVVDVCPDGRSLSLVAYGTVDAPASKSFSARLQIMNRGVASVIREYAPDACSVEDAFFAVNAKTALKLGQVRGVVLLAIEDAGLPLHEYAPRLIKQVVTGAGNADKSLVQEMVRAVLKLKEVPEPHDASDALAAAICHHHHMSAPLLAAAGASARNDKGRAAARKAGRAGGGAPIAGRRGKLRIGAGGLSQLLKRPGIRIAKERGK